MVPEIKTVTIVRGDNLWRISRKTYGQGNRYTIIYDANTQQIRNPEPDLSGPDLRDAGAEGALVAGSRVRLRAGAGTAVKTRCRPCDAAAALAARRNGPN